MDDDAVRGPRVGGHVLLALLVSAGGMQQLAEGSICKGVCIRNCDTGDSGALPAPLAQRLEHLVAECKTLHGRMLACLHLFLLEQLWMHCQTLLLQ